MLLWKLLNLQEVMELVSNRKYFMRVQWREPTYFACLLYAVDFTGISSLTNKLMREGAEVSNFASLIKWPDSESAVSNITPFWIFLIALTCSYFVLQKETEQKISDNMSGDFLHGEHFYFSWWSYKFFPVLFSKDILNEIYVYLFVVT